MSAEGLGILVCESIPLESRVFLEMKEITLEFKVAWARPDYGKKNMMRYGLVCSDKAANIEMIFTEKGCLKKNEVP